MRPWCTAAISSLAGALPHPQCRASSSEGSHAAPCPGQPNSPWPAASLQCPQSLLSPKSQHRTSVHFARADSSTLPKKGLNRVFSRCFREDTGLQPHIALHTVCVCLGGSAMLWQQLDIALKGAGGSASTCQEGVGERKVCQATLQLQPLLVLSPAAAAAATRGLLQLGALLLLEVCCNSGFAATRGLLQFVVCCNSGLLQLGIAAARGLLQLGGVATQGCCNSGLLQLGAAARLRCRPSCGAERGAGAALPPPQHRLPALLPSMPFFIRPPPAWNAPERHRGAGAGRGQRISVGWCPLSAGGARGGIPPGMKRSLDICCICRSARVQWLPPLQAAVPVNHCASNFYSAMPDGRWSREN